MYVYCLLRSLLPSMDSDGSEMGNGMSCGGSVTCGSSEGVEVWKSVGSALCTATNNPQNGDLLYPPSSLFSLPLSLPISLPLLSPSPFLSLSPSLSHITPPASFLLPLFLPFSFSPSSSPAPSLSTSSSPSLT